MNFVKELSIGVGSSKKEKMPLREALMLEISWLGNERLLGVVGCLSEIINFIIRVMVLLAELKGI